MKKFLFWLFLLTANVFLYAEDVPLADPFILLHNNKYYAYGTNVDNGIKVFVSDDLKTWSDAGLALNKNDVWGNFFFWAPEVYKTGDGFLMYFSAEEHICAAKAKSPLGPFVQVEKKPIISDFKAIDHTLFIDDDGTPWIFFVRLKNGNYIWMAQLEKDLVTIKADTLKLCTSPYEQAWEHREGPVNEGAAVLKHNGKYYLTYSGNGFTSKFYGIGYTVADKVDGKYVKFKDNPIYQQVGNLVGVGHHSFFHDKEGNLRIVFHSHKSRDAVFPRIMHISSAKFEDGKLVISPDYFTPEFVK